MQGNSFVQQSKLGNVAGRIEYIESEAKQEYLYAKYDTVDRDYWRQLAKECQQEFKRSGTEGSCIEARELIIALPAPMYNLEHNKLLKEFTDRFKNKYGVECCAALHHNKRRTNFHIHLIYSERKVLDKPVVKLATRNMYYDENGRHVRTKKEVTEDGKLRPSCKVIPKGQPYEEHYFDKKMTVFKSKRFLDEVKQDYTELINQFVNDRFKLKVFNADSPYLPTRKIGKHNPKEKEIREDNKARDSWNKEVNQAINIGINPAVLHQIKQSEIDSEIRESMKAAREREKEGQPVNPHVELRSIIRRAVKTLDKVIMKFRLAKPEQRKEMFKEKFKELLDTCRAPKQSGKIRERDGRER